MSDLTFTEDWTSQNFGVWNRLLVSRRQSPLRMLEIGCHEGRSTCWWLQNLLTNPESRLTCVDPWPAWREPAPESVFDRNTQEWQTSGKLTKRKGYSREILPQLQPGYDIVYIDGDHNAAAVLADSVLAWALLKVGGVMVFDDYGWTGDSVDLPPKIGVDAFINCHKPYLDVLHDGYQFIICRTGVSRTGSPDEANLACAPAH